MHAEIITTGSELVLGQLVDTNSAFIARTLRGIGLNLFYKTTVGDNEERMVEVLRIAMARSGVIITTGGLGPTVDDVTRPAIARATERELEFHQELLEQIQAQFNTFGVPMSENNRQQAYVPRGSVVIENLVGTAPAFIVEHERGLIISLPGVPSEMEYLLTRRVVPYLQEKLNLREIILARTIHAVGLGESRIDAAIADLQTGGNPTVGLSTHPSVTDIRIVAKADSEDAARKLIAPLEAEIRARLKLHICCVDDETLEDTVTCKLAERGLQLASVEAGTGGQLAGRLADARGGAQVFLGGRVVVGLGSPAQEIATALREESGTALVLAASAGATEDCKISIEIALATPSGVKTVSWDFDGSPKLSAEWAVNSALGLVWKYLNE